MENKEITDEMLDNFKIKIDSLHYEYLILCAIFQSHSPKIINEWIPIFLPFLRLLKYDNRDFWDQFVDCWWLWSVVVFTSLGKL